MIGFLRVRKGPNLPPSDILHEWPARSDPARGALPVTSARSRRERTLAIDRDTVSTMTNSDELERLTRAIVGKRDGRMVSPELSRAGHEIFASAYPIALLAALIPMLPGICVHALFLSSPSHVISLRKGDYQRLFNLLRGHQVATYDLTTFLVGYAGVKGPLLRELAGDSRSFRDIAKHQMENAILGDGLEPEMFYPADGRPPEQVTMDRKARHLGMSADELISFRDSVRATLLGTSA